MSSCGAMLLKCACQDLHRYSKERLRKQMRQTCIFQKAYFHLKNLLDLFVTEFLLEEVKAEQKQSKKNYTSPHLWPFFPEN